MPLVMIHLLPGRTGRAKRTLLRSVTDAVSTSLAVAPGSVRVILNEVPAEHWAVGGTAIRPLRRARAQGAKKNHGG